MLIGSTRSPNGWLVLRRAGRVCGPRIHRHDCSPVASKPRATIPWGIVGAIGLIVAIECGVASRWLDFSDPVSLSWMFSVRAAETDARGADVICLGDSLVKHGLIPSVIEHVGGRRTVNLSAARAPALMTYALARRCLAAGARPSAIVIDAKPAVQIAGPEFNARAWQSVMSLREAIDLLATTRNTSFVASTLIGRLLPSLRSRLEVQSSLRAALNGKPDRLHSINRVLLRNWTVNRGANVLSSEHVDHGEVTPDVERDLRPGIFYVDPANARALEQLLELASERCIPVFWVLFPVSEKLQSLRDHSGAEARYVQFVEKIQARHPRLLTVLDARRAGYTSAMFADATHLNSRGGIALSRTVAAAINSRLAGDFPGADSGWIALNLPADQPTLFTHLIEDLEQSQSALKIRTTGLALAH
jgi:hypothetical protein